MARACVPTPPYPTAGYTALSSNFLIYVQAQMDVVGHGEASCGARGL